MKSETKYAKRILVTGCAGFIASHVVSLLLKEHDDYLVVGYDVLDYCASMNNLASVIDNDNFKFVEGNILNPDFLMFVFKEYAIDHVMHFAAQSHVDNSFGNSIEFTRTNTLGTHTMLEVARLHMPQVVSFIYVSTDEVYGENTKDSGAFHEDYVLSPQNPYAASKAAGEMLARSYYHSFKLPLIITRGNNTFGPHQYPEKLIPKFINLILRDRKCCLHGDGSNQRSFVYCTDVAEAFQTVLLKGEIGQVYNIGTKFEISNRQVTENLLTIMKPGESFDEAIEYVRDRKINDQRYWVNYEKIKKLGWEPKVSFEEGLKKTIEWYTTHTEHWDNIGPSLSAHPLARQKNTN